MEFISALMEGNFTAEYVNGLTEDLFPLATGLITEGIIDSHPEAAFYLALAVMVEGQSGVEPPVWLWLRGAAEVNIGVRSQANFIRNYNNSQAGARTVDSVSFDEMSDISNIMAQRLFLDIKRSSGVVPDLNFIAENDARAAAGILFQDGGFGG
ncbi:hypothetical protein [Phaeobacter piscinae]|uniref:hypothetical protein n=1 Tax=Phaeobacter piscinae TaxID=1580596 RepID=UPI000F49F68A|nr:hypothetical protein [Phaeobacter piscinae]